MTHFLSDSPSRPFSRQVRITALLFAATVANVPAAELSVEVADTSGRPVAGAVVTFRPASGLPRIAPLTVEIAQEDRRFSPALTVVPVGSRVRFPNRDSVAHHVYSFSEVKKFDIPLYSGEAPVDVVFDRPGVVTLGCNIHDWMVAYVYVTATPFWAVSDSEGRALLRSLPPAAGTIEVWHPRLRGNPVRSVRVAGEQTPAPVVLKLRPEFSRRQAPAAGDEAGSYR
jgi:plastocyanin